MLNIVPVAGNLTPIPSALPSRLLSIRLTRREKQIVQGLIDGKRYKQIAYDLGLSECTIKVYVSRLYAKAGISDRLELMNAVYSTQSLKDLFVCPVTEVNERQKFLATIRVIDISRDEMREVISILVGRLCE